MGEREVTEAEYDDAEAEWRGLGRGLMTLESTGLLNQDAEPGGATIVDA